MDWASADDRDRAARLRRRLGPPRRDADHRADGVHGGRAARRSRHARARRPARSRARRSSSWPRRRSRSCSSATPRGSTSAALRDEVSIPARLLGFGLPLTLVAGFGAALVLLRHAVVAGGAAPRRDPRPHRRRARPGGRHAAAPALPRPAGAQRRERAQRRHLRAALLHRARDRAGGRRRGQRRHRVPARRRGDRLRHRRRPRRRQRSRRRSSCSARRFAFVDDQWLQVVPVAAAVLAYSLADGLGGSGFIAAFVGGMVFGGLRRRHGGEVGYLLEELGGVLNAITFIVFGAVMLGPALGDADVGDRRVRAASASRSCGCCRSGSRCSAPVRGRRRSASSDGSAPAGSHRSSSQ